MRDILIIGAGPTGSYAARRLAGLGLKVTVIEQQPRLGNPVCCAGIVSPECIEMAGIGRSPVVRQLNSACIYSPSGRVLQLFRSRTQAFTVNRADMDRLMAEKAIEAGAEYIMGQKITGIELNHDRVKLNAGSASRFSIEGRMLIMAAGFNPALTVEAGLGKVKDYAIGAQLKVEIEQATELKVFFGSRFAPGFFAWLEPIDNGQALAGLLTRKNAAFYLSAFIDHLKTHGAVRLAGKPEYRGVSLKPLDNTYTQRILVAGDCAGQVKPLTGGGVYYGLIAAEAAVKAAAGALATGNFSAPALAGYQRMWQNMIKRDIQLSRFGRRILESLSDRRMEKAFAAATRTGLADKLAADENLHFDHHGEVVMKALGKPAFYRTLLTAVLPWKVC